MTLQHIDTLFRSDSVALLGEANTVAQAQLVDNLRASVAESAVKHARARASIARLPAEGTRLAVILEVRWGTPKLIRAMGQAGYQAVFWAADGDPGEAVLRAARPFNLRVLGGRSAGVVNTRSGLNLSTLALDTPSGRVALITQSQSLAAAALDWAKGRNIGFSWLACTGAEADIDAADMLDYAALDPRSRAVVLQVGRVRSPRKFMSAARAAARIKPVLVLQTPRGAPDAPRGPDPVRSAAFARAGLVECDSLGGLFDGLIALELLPRMRDQRITVLGNGEGVCALGTDALRRQDLRPANVGPDVRANLARVAPTAVANDGAIDLGRSTVEAIIAAVRAALNEDSADAVLLIHAPVAGHPHAPLVAALANAGLDARLMTVWLGLYTALGARADSGAARLATFASVDEAARAVRYRARYHQTQALLAATPPPDPSMTADLNAVRARLRRLVEDNVEWLSPEDAAELLAAYGIRGEPSARDGPWLRLQVIRHAEFGLAISVVDEAADAAPVYGFAPLDTLLAGQMLDAAGGARLYRMPGALDTLAPVLVRIGRMMTDLRALCGLDMRVAAGPRSRLFIGSDPLIEITAAPLAERERLAMAPYPARMRHRVTLKDAATYLVRAIRPSDEPAVLDLLESLSPDEIRLRFFSYIRHFSHDMAARFTQVDYDREVSLVVGPSDADDRLFGMGTLIIEPAGHAAEFALLVHRAHTGVGLGRHLLDCLLRQAGAHGVDTVYGDVLAQNRPMLTLARSLGFKIQRSLEDATSVQARIDVTQYRQSATARADSA